MEDDNLLPNDGSSYFLPREPKEQVLDRKKEQAQVLEFLKLAEEMIKHFQERIEFRDKLSSIKVDISKDPALHQKVFEVNSLLKLVLVEEMELLQEKIELYGPK